MKMVKAKENLVGAYVFLVGVVLAIVLGLFHKSLESADGVFYTLLVAIGIVVGYFSVNTDKANTFLIASLSLVIVAGMGINPLLYVSNQNVVVGVLRNVLSSLMVLFVPATIVVVIKTVFSLSRI
jgi:protein-S-isoprenylcysteine O-methyltransferase Ste14